MADGFRLKIRILIKAGEGCIPHMYLDSVGKVTVGVGNMLPSASSASVLPFTHKDTDAVASTTDIEKEFVLVSKLEENHIASYYGQYTSLVLPEEETDRLLDVRLKQFEQGLKRYFPDYESYPMDARLGLMDMAYNLGTWGLVNKFPTFTKAAREQDWATCARECRRRQIQESRNEEVKTLFNACANPDDDPGAAH